MPFHDPNRIENRLILAAELLEPRVMLSTVQLSIAGQTNQEIVDVLVNDQVIGTINNVGGDAGAGQFVSYQFNTAADAENVKVRFRNDSNTNGVDRNVRLQFITVDGTRFNTDAPDVYSTGTWRASDGCAPGFKSSQWLTCNGFLEFQTGSTGPISGQIGGVEFNSSWRTINIETDDAVIIVGPPTDNDPDPGVAQIRNVSNSGFDLRFKQWQYLDDYHNPENANWMALSEGRFESNDGSIWEVGKFNVNGNGVWKTTRFQSSFQRAPFLFLTVQTANGDPVTVRARNVSRGAFDVALFEEQALLASGHGAEVVGYLAIEPAAESGVVELGGRELPYLLERKSINDGGGSVAKVGLRLEEERSSDNETRHAMEEVTAMSIGNRLFAQITSANGLDTTALRRTSVTQPITLPSGFAFESIVEDNTTRFMVAVEVDSVGNRFVADERGVIWKVVNGSRLTTPFLDIRSRVSNVNAAAGQMTGFALDPNFSQNGHLYVSYTTTVNGESFGRVERFTVNASNPNRVSLNSSRILIGRTKIDGLLAGQFHSMGDIEFGRDGSLLFSWGDSASNEPDDPAQFNSQNFNLTAGKIFRVNAATGRGLRTNPFYDGNLDTTRSKTWAYGLRNGFRFEVQPGTGSTSLAAGDPGRIIIADVGRDRIEELNISNGGENFGWPYYEGDLGYRNTQSAPSQTGPSFALSHPDARSIIGGAFVGSTWPAVYRGGFLAADFVEGWIRVYKVASDGSITERDFATGIKGITDMEVDPVTGDILIVGRGRGSIFGDNEGLGGLYRIRLS